MSGLEDVLQRLLQGEEVLAAFFMDRDGLIIEGRSRPDLDLDAVGALVSRGMDQCENLSKELAAGPMRWTVLNGEDKTLLICSLCHDVLLAVVVKGGPWAETMDGLVRDWLPMGEAMANLQWEASPFQLPSEGRRGPSNG